jgi:acyl dehydratase
MGGQGKHEVMTSLRTDHIGHAFPPAFADVEAEHIREFAAAIGESRPIYVQTEAARAAGYRDVMAPPTYAFVLKYKAASPVDTLATLGIEGAAGKLLHAEQSFDYFEPICAGDRLCFRERVADIYERKGGALLFVVLATEVTNQHDVHVATISHTEVVRKGA